MIPEDVANRSRRPGRGCVARASMYGFPICEAPGLRPGQRETNGLEA